MGCEVCWWLVAVMGGGYTGRHSTTGDCWLQNRTIAKSLQSFTITENAPTRAFCWMKAPTSTFTFKTLC